MHLILLLGNFNRVLLEAQHSYINVQSVNLLFLVLYCDRGFGLDRWELMNLFLSERCFEP